MAKRKITPKKKCAKKCSKKCLTQNNALFKKAINSCENKLVEKETAIFHKDEPGILSKIYRYFFPVR